MKPLDHDPLSEAHEAVLTERRRIGAILTQLEQRFEKRPSHSAVVVEEKGGYAALLEGMAIGYYLGGLALSISQRSKKASN